MSTKETALKALWAIDVFRLSAPYISYSHIWDKYDKIVELEGENAQYTPTAADKEYGKKVANSNHLMTQLIFLTFYGLTLNALKEKKNNTRLIGYGIGIPASLFGVVYGLRRYTNETTI